MDTLRERLVVLCTTHRLESVRVRDGDDDEIVEVKRMRMRRMESRDDDDDDVRRRATCDKIKDQVKLGVGGWKGTPKRRVRQGRPASGDPSRVDEAGIWTFYCCFTIPKSQFCTFFAAYRCFIPLIKMVKSEALACEPACLAIIFVDVVTGRRHPGVMRDSGRQDRFCFSPRDQAAVIPLPG